MRTYLIQILLLTAGCYVASGQSERYVTVTAKAVVVSEIVTNSFGITEAEAAEIISIQPNSSFLTIEKDGFSFPYFRIADQTASSKGTIIKGPATFVLSVPYPAAAYVTLKVMPEAYPPDKTVIVAPGTNQVQITLESSTNLVHWSSATNGVYGSPDEARFFRIHMQKLN